MVLPLLLVSGGVVVIVVVVVALETAQNKDEDPKA